MKTWLALSIVLALALVALFFATRATNTARSGRGDVPRGTNETPSRASQPELSSDASAAAKAAQERVSALGSADDVPTPLATRGIELSVVLSEPDGTRVLGNDVAIDLTRADERQTGRSNLAGAFEFGPLAPGHVSLAVRSPLHEPAQLELDLTANEPHVVREIVLVPWVFITVRARTPEGRPLAREMMSSRAFNYSFRDIRAVATRAPPSAGHDGVLRVGADELGGYSGIGFPRTDWPRDDSPDDAIGSVRFDGSPAYVSLAVADVVIATQFVAAGGTDVLFTLSTDQVAGSSSGVRVRVIDARTREPVREAVVSIAEGIERSRDQAATLAGDSGVVERRGLAGTEVVVRVRCDGYAAESRVVPLRPGSVSDVGDLALEPSLIVRGKVRDLAGADTEHVLEFVPLDPAHGRWPQRFYADGEAGFTATEIGPWPYVVRSTVERRNRRGESTTEFPQGRSRDTNEHADRLPPRVVDLTHWSGGMLELRLEPAGVLDIEIERADASSSEFAIESAAGLPVWSGRFGGQPWSSFRLARGSYRVTWTRADSSTLAREVTVGAQPSELSLKGQ